jgi:hypothetical protein
MERLLTGSGWVTRQDMQSIDSRNLDGIPNLCRNRAAGRRVESDEAVGTSEAGGGDKVACGQGEGRRERLEG